jgi:CRISPR system Cascade subunit CasC
VSYETDFFTAVDDISGESGAGMMGHAGFNSACFYRYACLDFDQLVTNLQGDRALAARTARAFLEAFALAIPTGKQNSMASPNPPEFALAVVREKGVPLSLANAFAKPVSLDGDDQDLVGRSVTRLDSYWGRATRKWGAGGLAAGAAFDLGDADGATRLQALRTLELDTFDELLDRVGRSLVKALDDNDRASLVATLKALGDSKPRNQEAAEVG